MEPNATSVGSHLNRGGVGSWIARRRRTSPDRTALVFAGRSWTYAELGERIDRLANALATLGVQRGDRVGYLGPNHPAFLELLFAAGLLGAIPLPINFRLGVDDIAYIIQDAGCRVVVYASDVADTMAALRSSCSLHTCIAVADADAEDASYEALLASAPAAHVQAPVTHDDLALMVYTSGTTGRPKGVMLTHGNLTWNALNFLAAGDFREGDVSLAIAPFFRVGGLAVTLLETLLVGGTVVLMGSFHAGEALRLIDRHGVTILFGGPELLQALKDHPRFPHTDFSSIGVCYTGGAPVPEHLLRSYLERGIPIRQGYGLSEAAPLALLLDPADMLRKIGSAGRPAFFTDVRIVRPDLTDAPAGDVGEVLVSGPNVMKGYWNRPELTRKTIIDGGWLRTGDAARRDDDGNVYIVGRMTDAYLSGDRVVFPGDIERILIDHPAVHDCAVVGVPDPRAGEIGVGFVVPTAGADVTEDDLLQWTMDQLDRPEILGAIRFTEGIPRNPAGKVLRHQLTGLASPAHEA